MNKCPKRNEMWRKRRKMWKLKENKKLCENIEMKANQNEKAERKWNEISSEEANESKWKAEIMSEKPINIERKLISSAEVESEGEMKASWKAESGSGAASKAESLAWLKKVIAEKLGCKQENEMKRNNVRNNQ